MKNKVVRLAIASILALIMVGALAGCASGITSGSWYATGGDESEEIYINFSNDGYVDVIAEYEGDSEVMVYTYHEKENTIDMDGTKVKYELQGKDTLVLSAEGEQIEFVLKDKKETPGLSEDALVYYYWYDAENDYELAFFSDGTWYADDVNYDNVMEGTYSLKDGKLTLQDDMNDKEYKPTLSRDRRTLTLEKGHAFTVDD